MESLGARRYPWIWVALLPIVLLALIRLLGAERGFPLVPLVAYTPYAAIGFLLLAGVALALRNWAAAGIAALLAACLLALVLPRAFGDGDELDPGEVELRILSANIHHGTAEPEALAALVERFQPDLLSIQELTPTFARRLRAAGVEAVLPEAVLAVRRGVSGAGLYARLPLTPLPEPERFRFRMPRARVGLPGGGSVRVVGIHPYPPISGRVEEWSSALGSLPATGAGPAWVLAGDFNATLDHTALRDVLDRGYRDAGDATGGGLVPTWPASSYRSPPVTIDHVLADERLGVVGYEVEDLAGSDHRAVFARLAIG